MVKKGMAKTLKKKKVGAGNNLAMTVNNGTLKALCWKKTAGSLMLSSSSLCISRQAWDI